MKTMNWERANKEWASISQERNEKILSMIKNGHIKYSNDQRFAETVPAAGTRYSIICRLRKMGMIETVRKKVLFL